MSEIIVPCEHCGKEGYDRVTLVNDHPVHIDCGKDVGVPPRSQDALFPVSETHRTTEGK